MVEKTFKNKELGIELTSSIFINILIFKINFIFLIYSLLILNFFSYLISNLSAIGV